jgi:hypothetical protein
VHIRTGITHGADDPVEGNKVGAVPAQGHLGGVDGFPGNDELSGRLDKALPA